MINLSASELQRSPRFAQLVERELEHWNPARELAEFTRRTGASDSAPKTGHSVQFEDLTDRNGLPTFRLSQCMRRAMTALDSQPEDLTDLVREHPDELAKAFDRMGREIDRRRAVTHKESDRRAVMHDEVKEAPLGDLLRDALRKTNLLP